LVLLLLHGKLLLDLAHLSTDTLVGIHLQAFVEELGAENEEENRCGQAGQALREQRGDCMAKDGRQDSHDEQGTEGSREDNHAVMLHSHQRRNQECLVSDLGEEDHR
jgi:hypothetical protein